MASEIFLIGVSMLAYDALGHIAITLTRLCAKARLALPVRLWNAYSRFIWPPIQDQFWYNVYWSAWHSTTLALLVLGFYLKK